jgi:hypothetical protein
MKLTILFWFYEKPQVCENHLRLMKKNNPDLRIFGLYGGKKKYAQKFKKLLDIYLDDFYISSNYNKPPSWKWIHGDLMILDWFENRGKNLKWDSVIVIQWDALVLGSIKKQFPGLKKNQIFISGSRILDSVIEKRWNWTKVGSKERKNYLEFKKYVADNYDYKNKLLCSLFILQIVPRIFFNKWGTVKDKEIGMLEYKIPTYAKIFTVPFYKRDLGVWWFQKRGYKREIRGMTPLNARGIEIRKTLIKKELKKKKGFRIFHPYSSIWEV